MSLNVLFKSLSWHTVHGGFLIKRFKIFYQFCKTKSKSGSGSDPDSATARIRTWIQQKTWICFGVSESESETIVIIMVQENEQKSFHSSCQKQSLVPCVGTVCRYCTSGCLGTLQRPLSPSPQACQHYTLQQCCGALTIFTVPVPTFDKFWFRFRLLTSYGSGSSLS